MRLPVNKNNFTEHLKQILINLIAQILNIEINLISIISVQDLSLSSVTRRLLQSGPNTLIVEIFVNDSTANMTLLTEERINYLLELNYAPERLMLPYVLLDSIEFLSEEMINSRSLTTTSPFSTTTLKNTSTSFTIVLGFAAGLIFLVLALVWVNTSNVKDENYASNIELKESSEFQHLIPVPELSDNVTTNSMNIADFYNVSRQLKNTYHL